MTERWVNRGTDRHFCHSVSGVESINEDKDYNNSNEESESLSDVELAWA